MFFKPWWHDERRAKLLNELSSNTMVITEADLKTNNECKDNDLDLCRFIIPPRFKKHQDIESGNDKLEPGECAICLSPYKVDDIVLWSQNDDCRHVFHCDCILTWLLKKESAECPCCRRE